MIISNNQASPKNVIPTIGKGSPDSPDRAISLTV